MTDEEVAEAKAKLDAKLGTSNAYIGIAFGYDLYDAFWTKGYITLRKFRAVGLPEWSAPIEWSGVYVSSSSA